VRTVGAGSDAKRNGDLSTCARAGAGCCSGVQRGEEEDACSPGAGAQIQIWRAGGSGAGRRGRKETLEATTDKPQNKQYLLDRQHLLE